MAKFTASPAQAACFVQSQPFTGSLPEDFSLLEEHKRTLICTAPMRGQQLKACLGLSSLGVRQPRASRASFFKARAAVVAVHAWKLSRVLPGPNRIGRELLYSARAPAPRTFFKKLRARCSLPTATASSS